MENKESVFDTRFGECLDTVKITLETTLEGLESLKARIDKLKQESMISVEMYEYIVNGEGDLFQ